MAKVSLINSNSLNTPIAAEQQMAYGHFLAKNSLKKVSFIDEKAIEKYESESAKRRKIATYSITGAVIFTLAGLIASPKLIPKGVERFSKFVNNKFKRLIEDAAGNPQLKLKYEKYQAKIKGGIEYLNVLNNFSTVKDAVARQKIYNRIPPLRWLDRASVDLYYKTSSAMCEKSFKKMFQLFEASDTGIRAALKNIDPEKLSGTVKMGGATSTVGELTDEALSLLTKRKGILESSYGQKAQETGRKKILDTLGDLDVPFWEKFTTIIKSKQNGEYKKLFNTFIAQDIIEADKARLAQEFGADALKITGKDGINARIQEILETILDKNVIQNEIRPFAQKADKSLGKALDMQTDIFADKMRDVCVSTAASDILGVIGTTGALGLYIAQAKNEEERTSVALTTGVPLALGIVGTTIATMKMVNGFKALGVGFATTLISNTVGKSLDKAYKKKHGIVDKEPSIPTIQFFLAGAIENMKITDYIDSVSNVIVS